jgi:folylpolyglutamate synthase/dihydropteroate synthase
MIAGILGAAGHRVGRYLSPHVHALEERIGVDGRPIAVPEPASLGLAAAALLVRRRL